MRGQDPATADDVVVEAGVAAEDADAVPSVVAEAWTGGAPMPDVVADDDSS